MKMVLEGALSRENSAAADPGVRAATARSTTYTWRRPGALKVSVRPEADRSAGGDHRSAEAGNPPRTQTEQV